MSIDNSRNERSRVQKNIVMIDNFDSFTYNLVDYLKQTGASVTVFRNTASVEEVQAAKPDLVVYSPGPGQPSESGNLEAYITTFSEQGVPQFGVCLGMQAMVEVFGGRLKVLTKPKHGKASMIQHNGEGIFAGLANPMEVGRYHSLAFDTAAAEQPTDLVVTATTQDPDDGEVVMAIQHKTLPIAGVQFHPESVLTFANNAGLEMIKNVVRSLQ